MAGRKGREKYNVNGEARFTAAVLPFLCRARGCWQKVFPVERFDPRADSL